MSMLSPALMVFTLENERLEPKNASKNERKLTEKNHPLWGFMLVSQGENWGCFDDGDLCNHNTLKR